MDLAPITGYMQSLSAMGIPLSSAINSVRLKDFCLYFGSVEENFKVKCHAHHPHNKEGFEFDESKTSRICGLFMEPPYLVLSTETLTMLKTLLP